MESNIAQHRPTVGGYTPEHHYRQKAPEKPDSVQRAAAVAGLIAAVISLIGVIVSVAVAQVRTEEQLKTKVDATAFEQLRGDVKVLTTVICAETPKYCQNRNP